jgi:hypothetical protein
MIINPMYGETYSEPDYSDMTQQHHLETRCDGCGGTVDLKLDGLGWTVCKTCRKAAEDSWNTHAGVGR